MKKNKFLLLSIAVICASLIFLGFGCKGISKEQQAATRAVNLEYWTVYDDVDQFNSLIKNYTATRPYIKVTVRQLRAEELYDRLIEALAEDKGPDLISVHTRDLKKFQSKLTSMPPSFVDTTMVQQKNIVGQVETIVNTRAVALPTIFQVDREFLATVKKDVILDNKIYGLPISIDTMAIYFNKDLLDRSQIAEPPSTWEQFQDATRKISKFNLETGKLVQSGAALGASQNIVGVDDILYILFKQSAVEMISRDNKAIFNLAPRGLGAGVDSPAMSVMTFYTDFANSSRDTYSWNETMDNSLESFIQGKTAFFFGYSYHNAQIKSRAPQLNYGILPMIQLDPNNPVNAANYWAQCVVAKSKNQNEAWGLVNYLTRSSAVEEYLNNTKRPTALRYLVDRQKEDLDLQPFVSQVLIADNWYRGSSYDTATQAIKEMIVEWVSIPPNYETRPTQWYQEVLNRAAAKINQTI